MLAAPYEGNFRHATERMLSVHFGPQVPPVDTAYPPLRLWWKIPHGPEDAAGAIIGARSGHRIPAHDIEHGPLGPDSTDFAGGETPNADRFTEDSWPLE